MISYEEALARVRRHAKPGHIWTTTYDPKWRSWSHSAIGSTLVDPLVAQLDAPKFDNSAVDGYGLRSADSPGKLEVVRTVAAGSEPGVEVGPGQAIRLFTGAPVPRGVDAVAMQEDCSVEGSCVDVTDAVRTGGNIRRRGEEYRVGAPLLPAGTPITPSVLSLLATNGVASFRFYRAPAAVIVTTGEELGELGSEITPWAVFNSNGPGLAAAVASLLPDPYLTIRSYRIGDDPEKTREALRMGLHESDLLITTGGVSVGDRDLVKEALEDLGVERVFWRVAMKPGKPVYFGVCGSKMVFGLPGNPVSALVTFQMLVRPAIRWMMGYRDDPETLPAELTSPIRRTAGRAEFVRGRLDTVGDRLRVVPTEGQGSHMMGGTAGADCLIHVPTDVDNLEEGDLVRISLLRWGLI